MSTLSEDNKALDTVSHQLFGDKAKLLVCAPAELVLLKKNARVFRKDTFKQLTANIRKDGRLSSMPLCRRMEDGKLEVLSGNHRVQAAVQAGIPQILVMVIEEDLSRAQQIAIQLSHNALTGEDDPAILAELWASISFTSETCSSFAAFFSAAGSMPSARSCLASIRFSRAFCRVTTGYSPKLSTLALRSK